MEQTHKEMKPRRRRIRSAVVTGSRHITAVLEILATAGVQDVIVVGQNAPPTAGLQLSIAETPAAALDAVNPGEEVVFVDADQPAGEWLADLLADKRANVLVVQPRLAHQLGAGTVRFTLEPIDVPWYSRRVIAVARNLAARESHGEVLASGILGGATLPTLRILARQIPSATMPDLLALLVRDHDFYAHAVPSPAWELAG